MRWESRPILWLWSLEQDFFPQVSQTANLLTLFQGLSKVKDNLDMWFYSRAFSSLFQCTVFPSCLMVSLHFSIFIFLSENSRLRVPSLQPNREEEEPNFPPPTIFGFSFSTGFCVCLVHAKGK